jgi:hypothetical protein
MALRDRVIGVVQRHIPDETVHAQVPYAPELIFIFRGPILRCSKGDLRAEVKRVVGTRLHTGSVTKPRSK